MPMCLYPEDADNTGYIGRAPVSEECPARCFPQRLGTGCARIPNPNMHVDTAPDATGLGFAGSVDAQNAFGALLRTKFRCWVRSDGVAVAELDQP
jgi:hypothetical protein